jgi:hypothetical protein
MNPALYACLLGAIVAGVAIAAWTSPRDTAPRMWPSVVGLGGLIAALLAVGIVSGTLVRHVIQVSPPGLALLLVAAGSPFARAAALPLLTFWAGLMGIIWLFLFGLARIIGGHFTIVEIVLTIVIATACMVGLFGGPRPTANLPRGRRITTAIVFGLLQLAALWISLQPLAILR